MVAHIDDFAIFSNEWKDHINHLQEVLTQLEKAGLTVKLSVVSQVWCLKTSDCLTDSDLYVVRMCICVYKCCTFSTTHPTVQIFGSKMLLIFNGPNMAPYMFQICTFGTYTCMGPYLVH